MNDEYCLERWTTNVGTTGTFIKHPDMTTLSIGENGISVRWTILDNNSLFTFTVDNIEYQAKSGMTWSEWINSEYNTNGFYLYPLYDNYIVSNLDTVVIDPNVDLGIIYLIYIIDPNIKYTSA